MNTLDIDRAILAVAKDDWQKVARVIVRAMEFCRVPEAVASENLNAFGSRVVALENDGLLEGVGFLEFWRLSEVRLKPTNLAERDGRTASGEARLALHKSQHAFHRASFAAEDAWRGFVAYGDQPSASLERALQECESVMRSSSDHGFILLMRFPDGVSTTHDLEFIPNAWNSELCDYCGQKVMAGEGCWFADTEEGAICCSDCYSKSER